MNRTHALVIGGSVNGLLAAAALAPHFEKVTVLERAETLHGASPRKQVPQGAHAHALLTSGAAAMERLLPGLGDDLLASGAIRCDLGKDLAWFQAGSWKIACDTPFHPYLMSRPLLESRIRARALALPNVSLSTGVKVERVVVDGARVTGVEVTGARSGLIPADLVVDASGRGSQLLSWLERSGFPAPPESVVDLGLGYVTAVFRRDPAVELPWKMLIVYPKRPEGRRSGLLMAIEGDRWMLSLSGYEGDHAPLDREGFLAWARSLARPEIAEVLEHAEMLEEPVRYLIPKQVRRHFERLDRAPEGLLAIGDVLCALDPVFGQGMSVGALEAALLSDLLRAGTFSPSGFYARAARIVDAPWLITASEAFRFPSTRGPRPLGAALPVMHTFLGRVFSKCADDPVLYRALLAVMNLERSPYSLFDPRLLLRLLRPLSRRLEPGRRLTAVPGLAEQQALGPQRAERERQGPYIAANGSSPGSSADRCSAA